MSRRDELDQLLDAALAAYSDREPSAGMEERIMRSAVRPARRPWLWWLAAAVPVAACLLVLVTNRDTVEPAPVPPKPAPVIAAEAPKVETPAPRVAHARRARRPKADKPMLFPAPSPLTAEERGLLQLAAMAPEALLAPTPSTIEIAPIEIPPLEIGGTH